jgi:hypothetical protein
MNDIEKVDEALIDNDDIFNPKWWEYLALVAAGTTLYVLELTTVWWLAGYLFLSVWMLQNCVRRLALRDARHTQELARRVERLEGNLEALRVGVDQLHRIEAMRRRERA